jgi:hypothetical protein
MKARPTIYKGVRMRSRLEALFAASIEGLCTWEYEPECFADEHGQYLPDFRCTWSRDNYTYDEIKPRWEDVEAAARSMEPIFATEPDAILNIYIPVGQWPNIDFHLAALRWGQRRPWDFRRP